MNRPAIIFHPEALKELEDAKEWYLVKKRSPRAAIGLMDELDTAVSRISLEPDRWPQHSDGTRRYQLNRYPYLVIFNVLADFIEIVAVAHTRRRPRYWRKRLPPSSS